MMKPIPKENKGLAKLSKPVRNNMGFMARGGKAKGYAYGSTVRSPMNPDNSMNPQMNPMMPRAQGTKPAPMQAPTPMTNKMEDMMYGGKTKKKM
jgi:hypothetical protein